MSAERCRDYVAFLADLGQFFPSCPPVNVIISANGPGKLQAKDKSGTDLLVDYPKIQNISLGLIEVRKHFLGGLYPGGLIFGGAYIRRAFCVSGRVSKP